MQIKNTTFVQRHIEKIAIGSGGLFLLLVTLYYLLGVPSKPFGIVLSDAKQGAMNISDAPDVMKVKAEELGRYLKMGKPPKDISPVDPVDYRPPDYQDDFRRLRVAAVGAGGPLLLPGVLPIAFGDFSTIIVEIQPYFLPPLPMATAPRAVTGHVVLTGGEDRSYVSVEAAFDIEAWSALLASGVKVGGNIAPLNSAMQKRAQAISGVYLEREEWNIRTRQWGDRRRILVDGQACYLPDQSGPDVNLEPEKAAALIKSIVDNQPAIQRPAFPALDPVSLPPLLREIPKVAPIESSPFILGPNNPAERVERPQPLRLWSHDLTVEPGRKYRYRLVACVLNPLYGVPGKDLHPAQAKENATRVSLAPGAAALDKTPWAALAVPATSHCFLVESANAKKATFEIWRVAGGAWVSASFDVKIGDAIGSKQAEIKMSDGSMRPMNMDAQRVLVDILEAGDPITGVKTRAVLLMGSDGRLETHYLSQDAEAPERKTLGGKR